MNSRYVACNATIYQVMDQVLKEPNVPENVLINRAKVCCGPMRIGKEFTDILEPFLGFTVDRSYLQVNGT